MSRGHSHHHHHHHHGGGGSGVQHATGAILLGAAAAAAAANHYASHQQAGTNNTTNRQRRDVILVQHPLQPPAPFDPAHPPFLHAVRPGQRSMLVLNDGSHQRPPGWRLRGHCELCLTRFGLLFRRHHCRNCGRSVCWRHSAHKTPLPHYGFLNYVRVCSHCYPVLLDCYRAGQPYTPQMLQQQLQQQQASLPTNPYAGPDNLASYSRPAAAQGVAVYSPVATHQAPSTAYYPANQPTTTASSSSSSLPRAELIYDGNAAVPARPVPTAPPPAVVVVGGQQAAAVAGAELYRPESGTARW